ncbi:DUF664 domain-containing protein [Streptomyces sp. JJ38]|nr:DUF664 domain-containing protein [Streptomyces sp. JJ38]
MGRVRRVRRAGLRSGGGRTGPPLAGGGWEPPRVLLEYRRATAAMNCEGLSDEEPRRRPTPPSMLTPLCPVRHNGHADFLREAFDGSVGA